MIKAVFGLVCLLTPVLAACEYPGVAHPLAAAAQAEQAPQTAPASRAAAPSPPQPGGGVNIFQGTVRVIQKDFKLDPDTLTVKAGAITFALNNQGRYTHDFRVEGQGVDQRAPKVGSGRTIEWKVTLQPGTYRISCPVSNHADRGMSGTLEIVP